MEVSADVFDQYYKCSVANAHPGQLDRAPSAARIGMPGDPIHTVHTRHGATVAQSCVDHFSNIIDKHKDYGHYRTDDYCEGTAYRSVNPQPPIRFTGSLFGFSFGVGEV